MAKTSQVFFSHLAGTSTMQTLPHHKCHIQVLVVWLWTNATTSQCKLCHITNAMLKKKSYLLSSSVRYQCWLFGCKWQRHLRFSTNLFPFCQSWCNPAIHKCIYIYIYEIYCICMYMVTHTHIQLVVQPCMCPPPPKPHNVISHTEWV